MFINIFKQIPDLVLDVVLVEGLQYMTFGKKPVLVLSVLAFREQKFFPDYNTEKRPLLRWLRSFTILLALVQHCLL